MKKIEAAIAAWYEAGKENEAEVRAIIKEEMNNNASVIVPVIVDETVSVQYLNDSNEGVWCAVFTDIKEIPNGPEKMLGSCPLKDIAWQVYGDEDCNGIVFNVWGNSLFLDREGVAELLRFC